MKTAVRIAAVFTACCAFIGSAQALEVIVEETPGARPISEAQRQADLALGNCLARNGGRMSACSAQKGKSDQIAQIDRETMPAPPASAQAPTAVVIERGPIVTEGPMSAAPIPPNK